MNRKGWERMLREIQCEKFAVGDYIALEKAEKIIKTIFGPKPRDEFLKKNQDNQVRNLSREQRKER